LSNVSIVAEPTLSTVMVLAACVCDAVAKSDAFFVLSLISFPVTQSNATKLLSVADAGQLTSQVQATAVHFNQVDVVLSAANTCQLAHTGNLSLVVEYVYKSPLVVKGEAQPQVAFTVTVLPILLTDILVQADITSTGLAAIWSNVALLL